ncbi:MAG: hypothetical protein M3R43_06040, partial [Acidobacteriota bacterium]|nr:hypothetical protein [Acidobacteriota bacterium]
LLSDFHVSSTRRSQFLLITTRVSEYGVRVGVNKTWREHSTRAINTLGIGVRVLDVGDRPDGRNSSTLDRDGDVALNSSIGHFGAAAPACRTRACGNLRRVVKYDASCHAVSGESG